MVPYPLAGGVMTNEHEDIQRYYARGFEKERLDTGVFRLELERTKELLSRFLPPPPSTVLDVGGGPGRYARWLAGLGYEVHLVDPVPRHVEEAREQHHGEPSITSAELGDARDLERASGSAEAVLLLGPLYHLTDREDRLRALGEAFRVLRTGGILCAAAISRYASMLDGLSRDLFADPRFRKIAEHGLATGQHRNPTLDPAFFTTAYFHEPLELEAEMRAAGFDVDGVYGIEGPGWVVPNAVERWENPRQREELLWFARAVERAPSLTGMSAHLLGVARKR